MTVARRRGFRVGLIVAAAIGALGGCSSNVRHERDGATGTVPAARRHGPTVGVSVDRGCPPTLNPAVDVANRFAGRTRRLLPAGSAPTAGLVCVFGPGASAPPTTVLKKSVRLDAGQARRLADAVDHVSLAPASGRFNCPAQFAGADTVIAVRFPSDGDVGLWYSTSGCRTLDNGEVLAFQGANPSFYGRFQTVFEALVPG